MLVKTIVAGVPETKIDSITVSEANTYAIIRSEQGMYHLKGVNLDQVKALSSESIAIENIQNVDGLEATQAADLNLEYGTLDFGCTAIEATHTESYSVVSMECNSLIVADRVPTMGEWSIIFTVVIIASVFWSRTKRVLCNA